MCGEGGGRRDVRRLELNPLHPPSAVFGPVVSLGKLRWEQDRRASEAQWLCFDTKMYFVR